MSISLLRDTAEAVGEPRTGARRFWTGREQMILRNAYPQTGLNAALLEKLPGRSARSIYQHAVKLELQAPKEAARGTPRQRHAASDHIDGLITRTYQSNPDIGAIKRLARTIARPRTWIRSRAIKLGVAVPRFKEPPWTDAETEIVAEFAHRRPATLQLRLMRAGFRRSQTAIVVKIKRLGASTEDPDHYTANGLAKLFGVDVKVVTGWIEKGWLKAKRRGTARLERQGGDEWWIHHERVRLFVADNVAAVDFRKVDKFWLVSILLPDTISTLDR